MLNRDQVRELARSVHAFAVEARRHLHRFPELSFKEAQTSTYVADRLKEMGYPIESGIGGFGIKAVLEGGKPGRTVALRADMDALPIAEETNLPFASQHPGVMHACGHDVHTATLLATARALKSVQADLPGRVVFIFQPGEEVNPGGASLMIQDGVLENPQVDAIFGVHAHPYREVGFMELGAGALMAAPDEVDVTIIGQGGHGARPHQAVDPVLVACQCITLLQQIVARNVSPFQQAVITVGMIQGGTAPNVIPDTVRFRGTVRTMDPDLRAQMPKRIEAVVRGVCDAAGASYKLVYDPGYPVLVNDAAMTEVARRAAVSVLGQEKVMAMDPSMGGEDFAYYLQRVPGSFARLGSSVPGTEHPYGLHTSRLMIDEECMLVGVAYFIGVVQEFLNGIN
ncbi:MAG TPA: amidohydrolase [Symbiobacteriaceae bacterium]|jgi:amidohydrolase